MKPRPNGSDVQNTVDLSTSVSVGAWMRAAPSPRSAKRGTKMRKCDDDARDPELGRGEQVRQDEQHREPRDLGDGLGADLPRNTACRGPLQISRLCGVHRSQVMDDVDVRQRAAALANPRAERPEPPRATPSDSPCASRSQAATEASPNCSAHSTGRRSRPARRPSCGAAGTGSRRATRTTSRRRRRAARAIARVTRKVGIPDPTSRRRTT